MAALVPDAGQTGGELGHLKKVWCWPVWRISRIVGLGNQRRFGTREQNSRHRLDAMAKHALHPRHQ